jgi:hypothetical protein
MQPPLHFQTAVLKNAAVIPVSAVVNVTTVLVAAAAAAAVINTVECKGSYVYTCCDLNDIVILQ